MEKVRITCKGADEISIDRIEEFQGELKELSKEDYGKLKGQILQHGFAAPFFVWADPAGKLKTMDGHQRLRTLKAMRAEGYGLPERFPVAWIYAADEKEAKRILLGLVSQYGRVTPEGLYEFQTINDIPLEVLQTDYRIPEVDLENYEAQFYDTEVKQDEVPEPPKVAIAKLGDVWKLGDHTILCGDSSKDRIEPWDLLVTDPPYGVSYAEKNEFLNSFDKGNQNQTPIENDSMTPEEMSVFWKATFGHVREAAKDGASFYVTGPCGDLFLRFLQALDSSKYPLKHMLVWAKNNHVLGRSDYHYKHEPIIYGWIGSHQLYGPPGETSLWQIDKPHESKLHPTMKPVELYARAIKNSSVKGATVCDPFSGSGTCIVAAEQLGRKCYAVELEPRYVDVAIQRWEELTGGKAKKA